MASKVNGTKEEYGKVVISLENCLLPTEKLIETPSMKDGLSKGVETSIRIIGCEFIQAAGILLKLPQVAMATGQVIFQRFFYSKSFVKHDAEVYAMACIFLAAKIEEAPRRIRDVINVFHYIKTKRNNRFNLMQPLLRMKKTKFEKQKLPIQHMDYMGSTYFNRKNLVVKAERRVLKELGFCVHVKHPHKIIINYLRILECENNQELTRLAWNYMNDSLRTNVFVRFPPETIACACIFLSARKLKICLPNKPYWFELFDATLEDLEEISLTILELYDQPKVSLEELLKKTSELRAEIEEKKKKAAEEKSQGATNSSNKPTKPESRPGSRATSPSKTSPFSGGEETKRKGYSKPEEEKKPTELKDRNTSSKQNRRSRSPRNRNRSGSKSRSLSRSHSRSRSKSRSRSHSRSRSRSRSYSLSVSPDVRHASDSFSSDAESPEQRRPLDKDRKGRSTVRPTKTRPRHRSHERRPDKKTSKSTYSNRERTYDRRPRARPRSRSPITRSRSRSPIRDKSKRYHSKHDRERPKSGDYYRNGVDYRTRDREEGGRDHSRRHR